MSYTKLFLIVNVIAALGAGVVSANDKKDGTSGKPGAGITHNVTWDEFKERCARPKDFNEQLAPQNIRIQCADTSTEFVPSAAGEVPLASTRMIMATVVADKFLVPAGVENLPIASKGGSCLRFKEVEKTLTIERSLTCNEVLGMKAEPSGYCQMGLDAAKGANPKLIQVRDTGRVIDTCGNIAGGVGKDGRK